MTETLATSPNLKILTTIPNSDIERPKTDSDINYLKNKNIDEAIRQKLRNKDVYESDMHKIYSIIVGQTNEQLKNNLESDATF